MHELPICSNFGHVPAEVCNAAPQQRMLLLVGQTRKVPSCLLLAPAAPLRSSLPTVSAVSYPRRSKGRKATAIGQRQPKWGVRIIVIMLNLLASSSGFLGSDS